MKKIIYITTICLFAMNIQAQNIDTKGLQTFIDELKALNREHVGYVDEFYRSINDSSATTSVKLELPCNIISINVNGSKIPLSGIRKRNPDFHFLHIESLDETGYNLISEILNKYHNTETEEMLGIPIMASMRKDGEEQTIFMNDENSLLIRDSENEIELLYGNFNLMDITQYLITSAANVFDEEFIDVEMFGGIKYCIPISDKIGFGKPTDNKEFPSANSDEIMQFAHKIHENETELLEKLEEKLNKLKHPDFIKIVPGSETHYVAIPKVADELKDKMKPYALNGVYDWINGTGFNKGASMLNLDQISCIITPRDVAREYAIRHLHATNGFDDGFNKEYKERATVEYQGGTPAILYRFSQNEKGYDEMLNDLGFLFNCKQGEKKFNLEVIQQNRRNGKRFVQLYGEGNILMCLFDSPKEKYCHMSIIVGGVSGFEQAVNEYVFGGEKDFAKKCNIIIDSNLSDNSYGIHFTDDEYFHAGKKYKNGVHINFGYFEKFNK